MHLFGLQGFKPMAAARVSGMRHLRVKRRDPSPASTVHYLRQAGALSAAIAKNMSGTLSQPGGELSHTSSSASSLEDDGGAGLTSFMEAHAQYSFIAVVALMSLFLVITISATGLLLAFCRKKNAVFTAPEKSDADSQLEMDDIDSSDVEMCRGDKGECYYHLSDDDDDGDDDNDEGEADDDDASGRNGERIKKLSKRSRTFPQLRKILERRRGQGTEHCKGGKMSKAAEPLVGKDGSATGDSQTNDAQSTVAASTCTQRHQTCRPIKQQHQDGAALGQNGERVVICRNPNHQHYSRQHHNCLYNRPHYHHRNQKRGPKHHPPYPGCGTRLQRSHTIHYIPQTQRKQRPANGPAKCGVQIKVRDMETIMAGEDNVEPAEVGTVQLHYTPTVSSSVRHAAADFGHAEDIFDESEANFSNLRLQVDNERDTQTTPSTDNDKNNNDSEVLQNFVELSETCIPNYDVLNGNYSSTDSRLLSDYLTCSTGFSPTNDCIFSRDKTHVPQATPQTALLEQAGPSHNHICPAAETVIDHRRPVSQHLTTFHNLFRGEKTEPRITIPATSSKPPPPTDLAPPNNRDQQSQKCISQHACIFPPPQGGPSKRLIHYHGEAADERRCGTEIQNQTEKINSPDMTNQRANDSRVADVAAPACNCYSNAGDDKLCAAQSEYDTTASAVFQNSDVLLPVRYDSTDNLLKLCPEKSHRASASGSGDDGGAAGGGDDEEDGDCSDGDTFIRVKTRENNNYSDEDDEDLTLSLLK